MPIPHLTSRAARRAAATAGLSLALGAVVTVLLSGGDSDAPGAKPGATASPGPAYDERSAVALDAARRAVEVSGLERVMGAYGAAVGTRLSFALDARIANTLRRQDRGTHTDAREVRYLGTLEFVVEDRREAQAVVAVRLVDGSLSSPGVAAPEAQALLRDTADRLAAPSRMRIDTEGRVTGYRFPAAFGYVDKAQLRALLAAVRLVVPHDAADRWTVADTDDTGEFEADYTRDSDGTGQAQVARVRTRYTRPQVRVVHGGGGVTITLEGSASARFVDELGWFAAVRFDERTAVAFDGLQTEIAARCHGDVVLQSLSRVAVADLPRVDWEAGWEAVGGDPDAALALAAAQENERWRQKLEGASVHGLVAELATLAASGAADGEEYRAAMERLAQLFARDPDAVAEVPALIARETLADDVASAVLASLGAAGTEAAQGVLTQLHGDAQVAPGMRGFATMALMQVQRPAAETLAAMLHTAADSAVDGDLARLSLMVLGTLAPRSGAALGGGVAATEALVALEGQCAERGDLDAWLHAVGNTGDPAVADRAIPHLHADAPRTREAAVIALRSARSEAAVAQLIRIGEHDPVPSVRARAAETLAEHGTPRTRTALVQMLKGDDSVEVRNLAMQALAMHMDEQARQALRQASVSDPDLDLRRTATELLLHS